MAGTHLLKAKAQKVTSTAFHWSPYPIMGKVSFTGEVKSTLPLTVGSELEERN